MPTFEGISACVNDYIYSIIAVKTCKVNWDIVQMLQRYALLSLYTQQESTMPYNLQYLAIFFFFFSIKEKMKRKLCPRQIKYCVFGINESLGIA